MPQQGEAPTQQEMEDAESGESKNRECCLAECMKTEFIVLVAFILTFSIIVGLCLFYGPERVMDVCLDFLIPPNPGWEHAVTLSALIAFLMIFPFPVVFFIMLLAGLNFGFWYGFIIILIPQPIGLSAAFTIGRKVCQEPLRNCVLGGNCPKAQAVLEALEKQEDLWLPLMLFRFLPVPFAVRNYTPTMLNVSFLQLVLTALPHCVWQAVLFASLGAMFKDTAQIARSQGRWDWSSVRWQELLIFVGSVVGGIGCAIYAARLYAKAQPDAPAQSGSAEEEEESTICCCCDRKACCTPSLRCGVCWGYFGFIGVFGIIMLICIMMYGANEVSMFIINAIPSNRDWRTAAVLVLLVVATQVLLIPGKGVVVLLIGLVFGVWPGWAYLFLAMFSALLICLAVGRAMGKPAVQECIRQEGWVDFRRFINIIEDDNHSMRLLVLYPFLLQPDLFRYYAPSVLEISAWKWIVCCVPWCLWISLVYSSLGATFQDSVALSKRNDHVSFAKIKWQMVAVPLVAVFVTPIIIWYACREYRKRLKEDESKPIRGNATDNRQLA